MSIQARFMWMVVPEKPIQSYGPRWLQARPNPTTTNSPVSKPIEPTIVPRATRQLRRVRRDPRMLRVFQRNRARMAKPKIRCRCMAPIHSGLE